MRLVVAVVVVAVDVGGQHGQKGTCDCALCSLHSQKVKSQSISVKVSRDGCVSLSHRFICKAVIYETTRRFSAQAVPRAFVIQNRQCYS